MDTIRRYIDEELISPPTPSGSHYGNPHITAFDLARSPSSPSSFSKFLVGKKSSSSHEKEEEDFSSESTSLATSTTTTVVSVSHLPSIFPLTMEAVEEPAMPTLAARSHPLLVTPNASFAEKDSNESSLESLREYASPTMVTWGSSPGQQHTWSPSSKRASVGLPSQYPRHHGRSSLAVTILEELQDFDELFEQSTTSVLDMDASIAFGESSYSGNRISSIDLMSSVRDDLFDNFVVTSSASPPENDRQKMPPPPPRRRKGLHRRSMNRAMDQAFFDRVLKEI